MAEREGSQKDGKSVTSRRALTALSAVGLWVALVVYLFAWAIVARAIQSHASPGRRIVVPELARSSETRCDDTPIVDGNFIWETCFDSAIDRVVRFDLSRETAKTWTLPAGISQSKVRGRIHGFASTPDGAVIVAGQSIVALSNTGVRVVATYTPKDRILGIAADADGVEVLSATPHREVAISKFWPSGSSQHSIRDHSEGMTAFVPLGGYRKSDGHWEVVYALEPVENAYGRESEKTVFRVVSDEHPWEAERFAEMQVVVGIELEREHYVVAESGMYPENFGASGGLVKTLLYFDMGHKTIERREDVIKGDPLEAIDGMTLLVRGGALVPVLQSVSGRFFGYDEPLQYSVSASGELWCSNQLVASNWGATPTVFAPQPDGGFVALNGARKLARLNAAQRRRDPLGPPERIMRRLQAKDTPSAARVMAGFILFGLPIFVFAGLIAGRRRPRFTLVSLSAFVWSVIAGTMFVLCDFATFAGGF